MKKKIILLGALIPVGALIFTACGPVEGVDEMASVDNASDNFVLPVPPVFGPDEWAHCYDRWDNDGNGLVDDYDPRCHMGPGPVRDLSLYPYPIGHNFFPDPAFMMAGGPGWQGGFRDPEQISRWLRFLTEPDGNIAGIDIFSPGVNPFLVPIPANLPAKVPQGTWAAGNNNNVGIVGLHSLYLDHAFLGLPAPAPAVAAADVALVNKAPNAENVATVNKEERKEVSADTNSVDKKLENMSDEEKRDYNFKQAGKRYTSKYNESTRDLKGGWPGIFYASQASGQKGSGSQGAIRNAQVGNKDH